MIVGVAVPVALIALAAFVINKARQPLPTTSVVAVVVPVRDHSGAPTLPFPDDVRLQWEAVPRANVASSLQKAIPPKHSDRDVLVFYLHGLGFSRGGKAFVADPDFTTIQDSGGMTPVSDVLKGIQEHPAQVKLLILDCAWIGTAPTQGMFVNEFPRLVEEAVQGTDDPRLWVLNSADLFQVGQVSYQDRCSIFGQATMKALTGQMSAPTEAADRDQQTTISLADLLGFVESQCDASYQTPILINGREGRIEDNPQGLAVARNTTIPIVHMQATREATTESATPPEEPGTPTTAASLPPDRSPPLSPTGPPGQTNGAGIAQVAPPGEGHPEAKAGDGELESKTAPPEKRASEPPPAEGEGGKSISDGGPPAIADFDPLTVQIQALWAQRDQLRTRSLPGLKSAPVDFAPHAWRHWNAIILHAEERHRLGSPVTGISSEAFPPPPELMDWLSRNGSPRGTTVGSIMAAWRAYQKLKRPAGGKADLELADSLTRRFADLLAVAADYVFLYDQICLLAPESPLTGADRDISKLLEALSGFLKDYRRSLPGGADEETLSALDERLKAAEQLREKIDLDLKKRVEVRSDERNQREIEALLTSPILEASSRKILLEALPSAATRRSSGSRADHWPRVGQRASLHAELLKLLPSTQVVPPPLKGKSEPDSRLEISRQWGIFLAESYSGSVAPRSKPNDAHQTSSDEISLTEFIRSNLVDPAATIPTKRDEREIAWSIKPQAGDPSLEIEFQKALVEIPTEGSRESEIVFDVTPKGPDGFRPDKIHLELTIPEALTVVSISPEKLESWDRRRSPARLVNDVALNQKRSVRVRLAVRWTASPAAAVSVRQTVQVTASADEIGMDPSHSVSTTKTIECLPAAPNRVDLVEMGAEGPRKGGAGQSAAVLELQPFPNRKTEFSLGLYNRHDRPKTVNVRLFANLPLETDTGGKPVGRPGRLHEGRKIKGHLQGLAERLLDPSRREQAIASANLRMVALCNLLLEPNRRTQLEWKPPPPAAAAPGEKPEPAGPPAPIDVTTGLLCLIEEKETATTPQRTWLQWVSLTEMHPSEYIHVQAQFDLPSGEANDRSHGTAVVLVDWREGTRLPGPGWSPTNQPSKLKPGEFRVEWDNIDPQADQEAVSVALLKRENAHSRMSLSRVPVKERPLFVHLTVDGYPRAFRIMLPAEFGQQGRNLTEEEAYASFRSLAAMPDADPKFQPRSYYWSAGDAPPSTGNEAEAPKEPTSFLRNDNEPAVFRPCDELQVRLAIDLPRSASPIDSGETPPGFEIVQSQAAGTVSRLPISFDRDARFHLLPLSPTGQLIVGCAVSDRQMQLPVSGTVGSLDLELRPLGKGRVPGERQSPESMLQRVRVALVDRIPACQLDEISNRRVVVGRTVPANIVLERNEDRGRLRTVRYWLDSRQRPNMVPEKVEAADSDTDWNASIETNGLKPGTYYLAAQVEDYAGNRALLPTIELKLEVPTGATAGPIPGTSLSVLVADIEDPEKPFVSQGEKVATVVVQLKGRPPIQKKADPATGTATFENLPPGEYTVRAQFIQPGVREPIPSLPQAVVIEDGKIRSGKKTVEGPLRIDFGRGR